MFKAWLVTAYLIVAILPVQNAGNLRSRLVLALNSSAATDSLYANLISIQDRPPLLNSYIGALQALKAKYAWNPYLKLKYLNDSKITLAGAVAADPHNIEIRFMRFSVENNVPGFLGDNKNLDADRMEIIAQLKKRNYSAADKEVVVPVIKYLLGSGRCTPAENSYLTKQLALLQ